MGSFRRRNADVTNQPLALKSIWKSNWIYVHVVVNRRIWNFPEKSLAEFAITRQRFTAV